MQNQFSLLKQKRFLPLFVTQFLGAFNDNFFKTAFVVLIAYGLIDTHGQSSETLVTLAAGVFVLPFVLLTPLGGDLADKYDKAHVIRWIKVAEILIVLCGIAGLILNSIHILMFVLFALGAQSALFSPSKFAILPQHLDQEELIAGNALVNTGTYLAILLGTILGTILITHELGTMSSGGLLLICALVGYGTSLAIPKAPAPDPETEIQWNTIGEAWQMIKFAKAQKNGVFTSIIGGSWFFFVGGLYLSQLPNYTSLVLKVDSDVLTFFMAVFSIGIALGGLLNDRLLRSKVEATFVPWAALMLGLFSLDLFFASSVHDGEGLRPLESFLSDFEGLRVSFDLFAISFCAGLYVVPLKAIIQDRAPADHMARILAASALLDAFFILASSMMAYVMFHYGFMVHHLFLAVAVLSLPLFLYIIKLVPSLMFWRVINE